MGIDYYFDMDMLKKRILELIEQKGVSYREASLAIGKNENFFSNMAANRGGPSIDTCMAFCHYIGMELSELYDFNQADTNLKKEIVNEVVRLCGDDKERALQILRKLEPDDINALMDIYERGRKNGG